MSIQVEVDQIPEQLTHFRAGYLLTASADGRIKAVSVEPVLVNGALVASAPGRGSVANATANPSVTVLYPPLTSGSMSLIVDGDAEVEGDDVRITPTGAVLHKPA